MKKALCLITAIALTLALCVPTFADSSGSDYVPLQNTPDRLLLYRWVSSTSLDSPIVPFTIGNPFLYSSDTLVWESDYSNAPRDSIKTNYSGGVFETETYMYYKYNSYFAQQPGYNVVGTAFYTGRGSYGITGPTSLPGYVLPLQVHYSNVYINATNSPTITFALTSDVSDSVIPYVSYQYYYVNTDNKIVIDTTTNKQVPFTTVVEDNGTFYHIFKLSDAFSNFTNYPSDFPIPSQSALIKELYIDVPFESSTSERAYYSGNYGLEFTHSEFSSGELTFNALFERLEDYTYSEGDFFDWVFNAVGSVFNYPIFSIYGVNVTPFGVFSLLLGLGLFVWVLKVFSGG